MQNTQKFPTKFNARPTVYVYRGNTYVRWDKRDKRFYRIADKGVALKTAQARGRPAQRRQKSIFGW